jgi:hypothetical protein
MSLVGKYFCAEINSTLTIDSADNANGQASGSIIVASVEVPVNIHYHFENNVGPVTDLWFAGNQDNPNYYVGGAGRAVSMNFESIKLAGGYPTAADVISFEGDYKRQ